ncbi:serine/threonine-protein kinase [Streptomyces sp. NPDC101132]|uniref:serine/threonine-protein kinase n=1 Tax=Streptomyces sp. NPDC101132 TaxID=3366110 RepID=UPI0038028B03
MRPITGPGPAAVGAYRLLAELGQGGMGRVLLGAAPDGRLVAVKQIHAEYADEDGFRARFRREVDASRKVSGACTAPVLDADPDAETPWLASVFVPGPPLSDALDACGGTLPEDAVRRLAAGLATALADIHRAGLVHRDLKPSNVLLAEDGVRVIDFGIARAVEGATRITHTGSLIGSPSFMAPEQALGREVTPAADVFALGSTLVAAATGRPPFAAESVPRLLHEIVHAEPDLTGVPAGLRAVVEPCLAKDPAARPTPEQLLALIGPVAPTARPWPGVVAGLIAGQRTEVEQLTTALPSAVAPGTPPPRGKRMWPRVVLTTAALVALYFATIGRPGVVWLYYVAFPDGAPLSRVDDVYQARARTCYAIREEIPMPSGFEVADFDGVILNAAEIVHPGTCTWKRANGDRIEVGWLVRKTSPAFGTGSESAHQNYEADLPEGATRRDADLDFADEAQWLPPTADNTDTCRLSLRDVNLRVTVGVSGPGYAGQEACEAEAVKAARAAIKIVEKK